MKDLKALPEMDSAWPLSSSDMWHKATQAALHKTPGQNPFHSLPMADLCQASYPFSKEQLKVYPILIFCWQCYHSIATPHIQLMKSTGYSGDLGEPFINIVLLPVSAVSSLIAKWTEEIGL